MALTTTTTSAAIAAADTAVNLTSVSGLTVGMLIKVDQEFMQVSYTSSTIANPVAVRRGINGTFVAAHVSGVNATYGATSDTAWGDPSATVITAYPLSGVRRKAVSYAASGAISLPVAGEDLDVTLIGTGALAMTLAVPTKDVDGCELTVFGNGKAAHTLTFATAIGNAGAGYTVLTFPAGGVVGVKLKASNGLWILMSSPISGTSTNVTLAIS